MLFNEKPHKQKFTGHFFAEPIMTEMRNRMCFSYSYLSQKDVNKKRGKVKTHIIFDTSSSDSGPEPISVGYFETEVDLPCSGTINNPMYCKEGGQYLIETWLKEIAIWSKAPINLLQKVTRLMIFGNNQHAEGIIKHIKENPELEAHCQQLATYMWWQ